MRRIIFEVEGQYCHIKIIDETKQVCSYQIKVEEEGLVVDGVEPDGQLHALDHFEHQFERDCSECWISDVPGWIYNNNDKTSGQGMPCSLCNPKGKKHP